MCILSEAKKISKFRWSYLKSPNCHQSPDRFWSWLCAQNLWAGEYVSFAYCTCTVQKDWQLLYTLNILHRFTDLVSQFQLVRGPSPACPLEFREVLEFLAQTSEFCVSLPGPVWWPVLSPQGRGPGCLPLQTPVKETNAYVWVCHVNIVSNCNLHIHCRYTCTFKTFNKTQVSEYQFIRFK